MKAIVFTTMMAILGIVGSHVANGQERQPQNTVQQERQPQSNSQQDRNSQIRREGSNQQAGGHLDKQLATCLAIDNWAEIQVAKYAESKSQTPEVKQFAAMLEKDHTAFVDRLKGMDPSIASLVHSEGSQGNQFQSNSSPNATDQRSTQRAGEERRDSTTAQRNNQNDANQPGQLNQANQANQANRTSEHSASGDEGSMLQIKREIASACVETFRNELASKPTEEFDRCFLGQQVGAHLQMLDTLKVFQRHASPELARTIDEATQATQQHLDQAKQLLSRSEGKLSEAKRPNPTERTK